MSGQVGGWQLACCFGARQQSSKTARHRGETRKNGCEMGNKCAALEQDSKTAKTGGGGERGEDGNWQMSIFTVKSEVLEKSIYSSYSSSS